MKPPQGLPTGCFAPKLTNDRQCTMLGDLPILGEVGGQDNLSVGEGGGVSGCLDNDLTLGKGGGFCSMPSCSQLDLLQLTSFA